MKKWVLRLIMILIFLAGFFTAAILTYPAGPLAAISNLPDAFSHMLGGNKENQSIPMNFNKTDYPYLNSHAAVEVEIILPPEASILETKLGSTLFFCPPWPSSTS